MPNDIQLVHGYNKSDETTKKLLVCRAGVMKIYNPTTGVWDNVASPTFTATRPLDAENFLNYMFVVDGVSANQSYNGTSWSSTTNLTDSPIARYIKNLGVYLYLGGITIRGTAYKSRVAKSNLPENFNITWGFETGTSLSQTASSAVVTSAGSTFLTNNIEVGDPITIEDGTNAGVYTVRSVDSNTQLTLTEALSNTVASSNFWVGDNWFDVAPDDGDIITGFGKNSNELLIFKQFSLWRHNEKADTLRQVKTYPGTSSFKSIVDHNEYTYYFDPTIPAIRRYDGSDCIVISNAIEDLLKNMSTSMYPEVVGWETDGNIIEFYIGDTTTKSGDSITKCVIRHNTNTEAWSVRSLPFAIDYAGTWTYSNKRDTYIGTNNGKVLKVSDGYRYDSYDISFKFIDQPVFPEGTDVQVDFNKLRVLIENGHHIQVMYKLLYMPTNDPFVWIHGDWEPLKGKANGEMVEFYFDTAKPRRASGIQLMFIESSGTEEFWIEKYVLYYSNPAIR